jgi:hypothetical protein
MSSSNAARDASYRTLRRTWVVTAETWLIRSRSSVPLVRITGKIGGLHPTILEDPPRAVELAQGFSEVGC